MQAFLDFLGWDGLSVADQIAVAFYATVGAVAGFVAAMTLLSLFGFSPRLAPTVKAKPKAKPSGKRKPPAKPKAKAKRKGGR